MHNISGIWEKEMIKELETPFPPYRMVKNSDRKWWHFWKPKYVKDYTYYQSYGQPIEIKRVGLKRGK